MEKIDSIVYQIIGTRYNLVDSPQLVVIGMIDEAGSCQWFRYDSLGTEVDRSVVRMSIPHRLVFAESGHPVVSFYNAGDKNLSSLSGLAGAGHRISL